MPHRRGTRDTERGTEKQADLEHTRVLYLESDESLRSTFTRCLRQRGLGVDTAATRREALKLLERNAYPIIVADLELRGTDAASLVQELCGLQPQASFVFTSDRDVAIEVTHRLEDSAASILRKPWTSVQLTSAVENARASYQVRRTVSAAPAPLRKHALLLIEPDADTAKQLANQLEHAGSCGEIKHCRTLAHAARLLRSRQFDAVLLDLRAAAMMDLTSSTALARLREAAPEAALFVLDTGDAAEAVQIALAAQSGEASPLSVTKSGREALRSALQRGIEDKLRECKLTYLAQHDPLTQLLNREAFREKLDTAVAAARHASASCAVMILDLAGWKHIDEAHGREAGDAVLCEIARRIQASVREEDAVARLDDDAFGVILSHVDGANVCSRVSARILDITGVPVLLRDDLQVEVRASIGVAICSHGGSSGEALLLAAEGAQRCAKSQAAGVVLHVVQELEGPPNPTAQRTG